MQLILAAKYGDTWLWWQTFRLPNMYNSRIRSGDEEIKLIVLLGMGQEGSKDERKQSWFRLFLVEVGQPKCTKRLFIKLKSLEITWISSVIRWPLLLVHDESENISGALYLQKLHFCLSRKENWHLHVRPFKAYEEREKQEKEHSCANMVNGKYWKDAVNLIMIQIEGDLHDP